MHGPKRKNALVATLHVRTKLLYGGRREMVPACLRWPHDGRVWVRYRLDGGFPRRGYGGQRGVKPHLTSSSFRAFRFATRYPGARRGRCPHRPVAPAPARNSQRQRKEKQLNAMPTPSRPAPSGTGRQLQIRRRPKRARRPGQIGACTDTPTPVARGGPLHRSALSAFFSSTGRGAFSFWARPKRGPRRAPRGGERRSKGAGAVFAAGGNGA